MINKPRKLFREALHLLFGLELILIYFYTIEIFEPSYMTLFRGAIWAGVYSLGLLDKGLYGLLPLLVVSLVLALCVYEAGGFKAVKPSKLACYILATLALTNLILLLYWIAYMWNPELLLYGFKLYTALFDIDAGLFHVYAPLYPLLLLATLYAWLLQPIRRALKERIRLKIECNRVLNAVGGHRPLNDIFVKKLGLASILLLSIALPMIPYLPTVNPSFKPVSVDIRYYSEWLRNMLTTDLPRAIEYALYGKDNGNRPLYLLILYALINLGVPRQIVLNFEALLIAPLFTLAVYFVAKRISRNHSYAFLASMAGLLGFNMTVGMMAGFFAAWMALIPFYECIALTLDLEKHKLKSLVTYFIASVATLYIHPWTWSLMMGVLVIHLASSIIKSFSKGTIHANKYLLALLAANTVVDILKTAPAPEYGGLVRSASVLAGLSLENFILLLRNLQRITTTYVGGLFFNPLHMALALIGILSLSKKGDSLSRLFVIWLAVVSVIFPFSDINLQSHLLFATPFPILIAEGLWALSRLLARFDPKLPRLLQAFFITSSLTYTVRALCNLI
jgi:hypothetical protein